MRKYTIFFIMLTFCVLSGTAFAAQVAYITTLFDYALYLIDTSSNAVEKIIPLNYYCTTNAIAINKVGTRVYVPCTYYVNIIDALTNSIIGQVSIGPGSTGIAVTPNGAEVYVATNSENVYVIDTVSNAVAATVPIGEYQAGIAVDPEGKKAYVAVPHYPYGHVAVIDTLLHTVTATVQVGGEQPYGVAITPDSKKAYVTLPDQNAVSVIDSSLLTVTATIPVGGFPRGIAVNPEGTLVYVTNSQDGSVSVIDTLVNTVTRTILIEGSPNGIGVTADGTRVYVAVHNNTGGYVSVIDTGSYSVVATVLVGFYPMAFGEFIGGHAPPLYTLTVAKDGNGEGIVTSADSGIVCGSDCSETHWAGTPITLLAEPATCRQFSGWSGICTGLNPTCEIILTSDTKATATFIGGVGLPSYSLTVTKLGDGGGSITSTPPGIECGMSCSALFLCTDSVRLEAVQNSDSSFVGWSGACSGISPTCDLMLTGDTTVTATFLDKRASAQYLPLVPGTIWKYRLDGQSEVTRTVLNKKVNVNGTETTVIQYEEENLKAYFTSDANGILLHRQYQPHVFVQGVGWVNIDVTFDPPIKFAEGVTGFLSNLHSEGQARTKVSSMGRTFDFGYTADTIIESLETVTVPAGTFDAIKFHGLITLSSPYGNSSISSTLHLAKDIGIVKDVSTDTQNVISTAELIYTNAGVHDLAITSITPPKNVILSSGTPYRTSTVKLTIQNKGPFPETIVDTTMLNNLIILNVESLGACPVPSTILHTGKPQKLFPIALKPGKTVKVYYDVTFGCANDPTKGTPDYRFSAFVNHAAIDGKDDTDPLDNVCPRSSTSLKDKGCGAKKSDGTLGGEILTDVVVK